VQDQELAEVQREPGVVVVNRELPVVIAVAGDVPAAVQILPSLARQVIEQSRLVEVADGCEDVLLGAW
jgi:hypothetical protein